MFNPLRPQELAIHDLIHPQVCHGLGWSVPIGRDDKGDATFLNELATFVPLSQVVARHVYATNGRGTDST